MEERNDTFGNIQQIPTHISSKMLKFWKNVKKKRMENSRNHFEPILQENEDEHSMQKIYSATSNDTSHEFSIHHHSFNQNILHVEPLIGTTYHSKAHFLSTKQLMALTFFAVSAVRLLYKINLVLN